MIKEINDNSKSLITIKDFEKSEFDIADDTLK